MKICFFYFHNLVFFQRWKLKSRQMAEFTAKFCLCNEQVAEQTRQYLTCKQKTWACVPLEDKEMLKRKGCSNGVSVQETPVAVERNTQWPPK